MAHAVLLVVSQVAPVSSSVLSFACSLSLGEVAFKRHMMIYATTNADGENNSLQQHSTLHVRLISHINQQIDAPFSALETVGLETMTGRTLGALVMAPRWTMPMRPQPMTPTLISFSSAPESVMERADRVRKEAADEAEGAKASVEAAHARNRRAEKRIVASSTRYVVGPGIRGGYAGDVGCHALQMLFPTTGFFK